MSAIGDLYERRCHDTASDIYEHLPLLRYFASQCDTVVEFGVRGGDSTVALLSALANGSGGLLISVDIEDVAGQIAEITAAWDVDCASGEYPWLGWSLHVCDDLMFVLTGGADLLFIDTEHTYPQLHAELETHGDNVRRWIAMHDTETYGDQLNPAIAEFLATRPEWREVLRLHNCNGLTVLEREQ